VLVVTDAIGDSRFGITAAYSGCVDQIKVVFLGTSAGLPSRTRNVAAVTVVMDGRVLLFDCGEGTQQQLLRSSVRVSAIDSIFLTHLHGDHCYGMPGLLASMSLNGREAPLTVYGAPGTRDYIEGVIRTTKLTLHYPVSIVDVQAGEVARGAGYSVVGAELDHSRTCFGFAIVEDDRPGIFDVERARKMGVPDGPLFGRLQRGEDVEVGANLIRSTEVLGPARRGRRVVYCTDTRPCDAAVELARDADLLIHEATYAQDMAAEARERAHSTAAEAAEVARRAGVRQLVLTHISPRYLDAALLVGEASAIFEATSAAEDFSEYHVTARS
jgi:ribonuclease Z